MRAGLLAEFETADAFLRAAATLRERGYRDLDGFTPFPVHGAEAAFGLRRSGLAKACFVAAVAGAGGAYFLQWWMNAYDYPLNVGGRPPHAPPFFFPITFEMGILFCAVTALTLAIVLAGLPRLWHPVFEVHGFERATIDRFFLGVEATDPKFDRAETLELLEELGALRVVPVGDEEDAP